ESRRSGRMTPDRILIDTIKETFTDYASTLLQEIAQSHDHERWSREAVVAAREILADRAAGGAREPLLPQEPEPAPPPAPGPSTLGISFGLMAFTALTGGLPIPRFTVREVDESTLDQPIPFGSRVAWLAVETTDTEGVAAALGLKDARPATW